MIRSVHAGLSGHYGEGGCKRPVVVSVHGDRVESHGERFVRKGTYALHCDGQVFAVGDFSCDAGGCTWLDEPEPQTSCIEPELDEPRQTPALEPPKEVLLDPFLSVEFNEAGIVFEARWNDGDGEGSCWFELDEDFARLELKDYAPDYPEIELEVALSDEGIMHVRKLVDEVLREGPKRVAGRELETANGRLTCASLFVTLNEHESEQKGRGENAPRPDGDTSELD